ncbi:hypothetical protein BHE74_00027394 [Ensete ventricosum]|nr:hypothetical protein BHE74_00027394 [Ensete ventricosum]RZS01695.1 hypothetical protein BHM03_00031617 [Ensete ventricosum]
MLWDLAGSSLGDSPKGSGSSLETHREIAGKKTGELATRMSEAGTCNRQQAIVVEEVAIDGLGCAKEGVAGSDKGGLELQDGVSLGSGDKRLEQQDGVQLGSEK